MRIDVAYRGSTTMTPTKRKSYRSQADQLMLDSLEALRLRMIEEARFDDAMLLRDVKLKAFGKAKPSKARKL